MNPNDGRGILALITKKGIGLAGTGDRTRSNESLFTRLELPTEAESRSLFALLATLRQRAGDFD